LLQARLFIFVEQKASRAVDLIGASGGAGEEVGTARLPIILVEPVQLVGAVKLDFGDRRLWRKRGLRWDRRPSTFHDHLLILAGLGVLVESEMISGAAEWVGAAKGTDDVVLATALGVEAVSTGAVE